MTADPTMAEMERLLEAATPLIECDRRTNRPDPCVDGERIVGFVIDQDFIGLGLSEPLFALEALVNVAKALPSLIAREKALREALSMFVNAAKPRRQDGYHEMPLFSVAEIEIARAALTNKDTPDV